MNYSPSLKVKAEAELEYRRRSKQSELEPHRQTLLDFTRYTFEEYRDAWFHRTTCRYLERFVSGQIKRLMIFMPPRHGKSELVSRRLPAYILGKNPDAQIIATSYSSSLAKLMNRSVQRIIDEPKYADLFPNTKLSGRSVQSIAYGTWLRNSDIFEVIDHVGVYRSAGVGGSITGMGMNYGIIDDPFKNRQEADSPTIRNNVYEWYRSTFRTRLAKGGGILLTVTRWHEDDLAGRLLEDAENDERADQWAVLRFPAVADGSQEEYDTRSEGEPLWADEFNIEFLQETETSLGDYDWNSLYQQNPTPSGGSIFKADYWGDDRNRYSVIDDRQSKTVIARWIFYDTAFKSGVQNDYSVGSVFELLPDYRIRLRHVWREKVDSAFLPDEIDTLAKQYNQDEKLRGVVIEDKGSGTTSIQTIQKSAPRWLNEIISGFMPSGSKEYRAKMASIWCKRGCVLLPYPDVSLPWYNETIDTKDGELFKFPASKNDDFVDTFTMAIIYLENYLAQGYHD